MKEILKNILTDLGALSEKISKDGNLSIIEQTKYTGMISLISKKIENNINDIK